MVGQQLEEYINQQRKSGVSDQELAKRLAESGWDRTDINSVLGKDLDEVKSEEITNLDLSSPGVYDLGVKMQADGVYKQTESEINRPVNQGLKPEQEAQQNESSKTKKTGNKLIGLFIFGLILVLSGGVIFWIINSKNDLISPMSETKTTSQQIENQTPTKMPKPGLVDSQTGYYTDNTAGFLIRPPADWHVDTTGTFGTLVVFTNPDLDLEGDNKFTANMNIVAEETSQNLEDYISDSKELLAQNFTNHVLVSERQTKVGDHSAAILESTFDQGIFKLHNLQMVVVAEGKAYVTTAVALDSTWDKYQTTFENTLASFELK